MVLGWIATFPIAVRLMFQDAERYRSISDAETVRTSAMLSNPLLSSSGGRREVASISNASRSRIAFAYSARFSRWSAVRPGRGFGRRGAVDGRLQMADEPFKRGGVRTWHPGGRHHPGAHFPDHLLPQLGRLRHVGEIRVLEGQFTCARPIVVACDAVGLHERGL